MLAPFAMIPTITHPRPARFIKPMKVLDADDPCPVRDCFTWPAEWALHERTGMCWPCRPEAGGGPEPLPRAKPAFARAARAITTFEPVTMAVRPHDAAEARLATAGKADIFEVPLDDSWARDMGPTFLRAADGTRAAVQWRFNAWGNKYHPYDEDAKLATRIARAVDARVYEAPLVCEGGAIHGDGEGTLIAAEQTLLNTNRNPELTQQDVEESLALYSGARRIVWLGEGFSDDEPDGHIDNIACFVAPGRVLVGVPASKSHPDFEPVMEAIRRLSSARGAEGRKIEIVELEQPRNIGSDHRGRPLQKSYVNFYLANGGVVMPGFEDPQDEKARVALAHCFPGRDILQIDANDIVQGGGGIHCITQQEPA